MKPHLPLYKSFLFLFVMIFAMPVLAQTPQFFSGLPDVPIMPGLEEVEGETILFDKPEGRIIEASARATESPQYIMSAYRESLPQFGWVPISGTEFFRKNEYLVFDFEEIQQDGIVKIMIKPSL